MQNWLSCLIVLTVATANWAQTTINGNAITVRSTGSALGSSWNLSSTGFVGTYITVPSAGTVSFTLNANQAATGSGTPRINLVVADTKTSFNLSSTSATNYNASAYLPAGTYFVRTERDYRSPADASSRAATVNSLTVGSGAVVSNLNTGAIALAAADTYISNFRKGPANVALTGPGGIPLLAGTKVNADMSRIAFNFGTAVPGITTGEVNGYLGNSGTAKQVNYQAKLNQNFNAVVPENAGKWPNNEATRNVPTMASLDTILNYARSHNMTTRMHNVIWGAHEPTWAAALLTQAGTLSSAKDDLRSAISSRISYYVGTGMSADRANKYAELDIFNESYHTGAQVPGSFWNVFGPLGIADIYRESKAAGPNVRMFVNEYNVYASTDDSSRFATYFKNHTETLRDAGFNAGYGDIVGGVGTQYYVNNVAVDMLDPNRGGGALNTAHDPARIMQTVQALSAEGLPISLTEFGVKSGVSAHTAAQMLADSMRIAFGNPNANGFMMWGHVAENGGGNLFAPAAALYTVDTSNWNAMTLTEAGQAWQQLLGIQSGTLLVGSDNKAVSDPWATHLTDANAPTVNADGSIDFTGYYGDYLIGGQALTLQKGTTQYAMQLAMPPQWHFWGSAHTGTWSTATNWTNGAASGVGDTAHFGASSAASAITVASPVTVGMINFDGTGGYSIGGGGTITMDGPAARTAINVVNGIHTISAPLVLAAADALSVNTYVDNSSISILDLQSSVNLISKNGPGMLAVNNVRAAGLNIHQGTVTIANNGTDSGASKLDAINIVPGATLDLTNNDLIVRPSTPMSTLVALIQQARNGGDWNQPGITSSAARSHSATSLGAITGEQYLSASGGATLFAGLAFDPSDTLIKYTYFGDTDFNGLVDFDDYSRVDAGFNNNRTGWLNGDVDSNGIVDFDDYSLIDQAFNTQSGTLRRAMAYLDGRDRSDAGMDAPSLQLVMIHLGQFGEQYAAGFLNAVPEPCSVAVSALVSVLACRRRRQR